MEKCVSAVLNGLCISFFSRLPTVARVGEMGVGRGSLLLTPPSRPRLRLWTLWTRCALPPRSHQKLYLLDHYPAGDYLAQRQSRRQPQAT